MSSATQVKFQQGDRVIVVGKQYKIWRYCRAIVTGRNMGDSDKYTRLLLDGNDYTNLIADIDLDIVKRNEIQNRR